MDDSVHMNLKEKLFRLFNRVDGITRHPRLPVTFAYLALLTFSLAIPLLHHFATDRAIAGMRPVLKHADGSYSPMLMPGDLLAFRWLGQLSWWVPFVILAFFVISFQWKELASFKIICGLALCQCAFTTFYAMHATMLLVKGWWTEIATRGVT